MTKKLKLSLYRFDPAKDKRPYMSDYEIPYSSSGNMMVIDAIRTAHVTAMTPMKYGILRLDDFSKIVEENPSIGGPVYLEVAKAAVNNLATASQDISNLTQAFFFSLTR